MVGDPFGFKDGRGYGDQASITRNAGLDITEPVMSMKMDGDNLLIDVSMPDVKSEEISLKLRERWISVSCDRTNSRSMSSDDYFSFDSMTRTYRISESLPMRVVPDKADVNYENGMLRIRVPVKKSEKHGDSMHTNDSV